MAFSLKLKKKIRFSSPLSDQSIFPSSWSVPIDSDQEAGKYSWKFHKNLKIFWVFFPFFQISGVSDWALDQSHQESGKIYPIFMYTKWLQSITVIISEELCFVSHQYWSYHIVSLLPDHYRPRTTLNLVTRKISVFQKQCIVSYYIGTSKKRVSAKFLHTLYTIESVYIAFLY